MKRYFLLLLALVFLLAGCGQEENNNKNNDDKNKLPVAASFFPMAEFARAVGGEHVAVFTLVPDGAEPHAWEPAPRDLTRLGRARVFVYNGMVEPWAEQALAALSERKILALEAGQGLFARDGRSDPHVWTSPKKAIAQAERVAAALCAADAEHADAYRKNCRAFASRLEVLDKRLAALARTAPKKVFVTAHAAFGHLAADYGLRQLSVAGISAEAEPTPADLKRLIATVKREKARYVFFERLTDPKIARIVAQECGARTAVLDPLEGLDAQGRAQGWDYLKLMEQNIENLERALQE